MGLVEVRLAPGFIGRLFFYKRPASALLAAAHGQAKQSKGQTVLPRTSADTLGRTVSPEA